MNQKEYVSTSNASTMLVNAGLISKSTNYPDQATKRLIKQGILKAIPPRKDYPKEGYRVDVESINSYIKLGKLNPGELVKMVLELTKENAILKEKKTTVKKPRA